MFPPCDYIPGPVLPVRSGIIYIPDHRKSGVTGKADANRKQTGYPFSVKIYYRPTRSTLATPQIR